MLEQCEIYLCEKGILGLNLSRAPWDPYPWVSEVQKGSSAECAGIRIGDTLIKLNGFDVFGIKISALALHLREHWENGASLVTMLLWRCDIVESDKKESHTGNINQLSLQKFAICLQRVAQLLECPVCFELVKSPGWQCGNGHLLCHACRKRSDKCPVCRVPLGSRGRCLLSEKLFALLTEGFSCVSVVKNDKIREQKRLTENSNQPKEVFEIDFSKK